MIEMEFTLDEATGQVGVLLHCPGGFAPDWSGVERELTALLGPGTEADLPVEYVERLIAEQRGLQV